MKLCECGCGEPAPIATATNRKRGYVKGEPRRFVLGHHGRVAPRKPVLDRLMEKVIWNGDEDECWEWQGGKNDSSYGLLRVDGREAYAHRVSYELFVGPIPDGLEIDHLCRRPNCVNPAHLEAVSHRENILRGTSPAAVSAAKTHCSKGHPLSGPNVYMPQRGGRQCRTCTREGQRRRRSEGKSS